jgi:allene oxide cyclase-like protein
MIKHAKLTSAAIISLPMLGLAAPTANADSTLTLFEHDNVQYQADLGGPGPGPGDQFIFAGDVFDHPGGMFLGTASGSCSTLTGNDKAGQSGCNTTFNLAGGQIVIQGVADTAAVFQRGDVVPFSIVGGTGSYQNARGTGTIQVPPDVPDLTDANFVLNLAGG